MSTFRQPGIGAAFGAALLFGAGAPLAKLLLHGTDPWMLAGLLYLGSGIGLSAYRLVISAPRVELPPRDAGWFVGAVVSGGVIGPVLLMFGLTAMPASGASLLLNAEGAFTALLAWFLFKENFDRRIALGMFSVLAGATVLSWPRDIHFAGLLPALFILGACLAWGIDNNLTRRVSLTDATWIASVKGLAAGTVNIALAFSLGSRFPSIPNLLGALSLGLFAYGVSLTLFVVSLRHLGSARTGAYFSVAPFFGALVAVGLGESVTPTLVCAGVLMAIGVWLHLSENHVHEHRHMPMEHEHEHMHDEHHLHDHDRDVPAKTQHSHVHRHPAIVHRHVHFPDAHHRHEHS